MTYITPLVYRAPAAVLSDKSARVETLRGLAIILVVIGHVIGSESTGGMRVADDSIFRWIYFSLEYIRMPLFTVISGWVYANKPIKLGGEGGFIKGKLRRLILPMLVISTLLFLMRTVIPGTNSKPDVADIWYNLIFPYDLFWFLYSLFLIFIVVSFLDTRAWFRKLEGWAAVLFMAFIVQFLVKIFLTDVPNFFSFKGATYLFPFFLIGIGIVRFKEVLFNPRWFRYVGVLFLAGIVLQQLMWFGVVPLQPKHSLIGIAIGISAALLLFNSGMKNGFLTWIGGYAYSIFLFHVFFTGGTRIVLIKAGITNQWLIFIVATILSILIPIVIENLFVRSRVLRLLFLGRK